jgi:hypothetical protein
LPCSQVRCIESYMYIETNDITAEIEKGFSMLHFNLLREIIGTKCDEDLTAYVYIEKIYSKMVVRFY